MRLKPLIINIIILLLIALLISCSYIPATTNTVADLSETLFTEETSGNKTESSSILSPSSDYTNPVATVGEIKSADAINFPDCVNFVLPESLKAGDFDLFLGMGGGIPLYNDKGELCGCFELHLYGSSVFKDGEFIRVAVFANHSSFESDFIPINSSIPCIAVKYSKDVYDDKINQYNGEQVLWYAFWAKEGYTPQYALYLFAEDFGLEDLEAIASSVTFTDEAFIVR